MSESPGHSDEGRHILPPEAVSHYRGGREGGRLSRGTNKLEHARTRAILGRVLPPPPAVIVDAGGGTGVYALWLARLGYCVHLVDAMPAHVEEARSASDGQPEHPLANSTVGDARSLDFPDSTADAVLLLGPLYHLTDREDRVAALAEARRVLRSGGVVCAVGISRFVSTFNGLFQGLFADDEFARIAARDRLDGQHRNAEGRDYFTTAFFHHPDELRAEVSDAGLHPEATLGVEGPGWLLGDFEERWRDPVGRGHILDAAHWLEEEPSLLGLSVHLMVVARKATLDP